MKDRALENRSLISRTPDILATDIDDELVLMSIDLGNYYGISSTARRIWELLDAPTTLGALLERLAGEFDAPVEILRADVCTFLEKLQLEGLVAVQ